MRKLMTYLVLLCGLPLWLGGQAQQAFSVHFATDRHELSQGARQQLDAIAAMTPGLDYTLDIQGHTDGQGDVAYNQALAERRAAAVRSYLAQRGVVVEKTTLSALGKMQPIASNDDDEGRQRNRRVEIVLTQFGLEGISDLLSRLGKPDVQVFTFDADKPYSVNGEQGTRLWIEAHSFVGADGSPVQGEVELHLSEYYERSAMLASSLPTLSGDQLLETGGMLKVEAFSNGQALKLASNKPIWAGMPTTEAAASDMLVFSGSTDAQGNVTDWTSTQAPFSTKPDLMLNLPNRPRYPVTRYLKHAFGYDESTRPRLKAPPRKPYEPILPKREQVKYDPPFFTRLAMGKEKIQLREDSIFQDRLATYHERMLSYQQDMLTYQEEILAYETAKKEHKIALAEWKVYEEERLAGINRKISEDEAAKIKAKEEKYQQQLAIWKEVCDLRIAEFEAKYETQALTDASSLNRYFGQVSQLGWINCDRFYNTPPAQRMQLAIQGGPHAQEQQVFVVFKRLNSMIPLSKDKMGRYISPSIPAGEDISILAVKVEGGRALMSLEHTTAQRDRSYALAFAPASLHEIRATLQRI